MSRNSRHYVKEDYMSYFKAQQHWLVKDLFSTTLNKPDRFKFPCIQLTFNTNIFLLDITTEDENDISFGERLFFGSIDDVLNVIKHNETSKYKIALLSPRHDNNGEYVTSDIIEVLHARDSKNQLAYVYCCKNKKRYVDSLLGRYESDLKQFKTIYKDE